MMRRPWLLVLLVCAIAALAVSVPVHASIPAGHTTLTTASPNGGLPLCVVSKNPAPEKPDAPLLWHVPEDGARSVARFVAACPRPSAGERRFITSHLVYTLITSSRL
mgnify:CR=1 FL=1